MMRETCLVDKRCVHYNEAQQCPHAIDCRNKKIAELQAKITRLEEALEQVDNNAFAIRLTCEQARKGGE